MSTNNASRYAGMSLLFIHITFNCPETEAEILSSRPCIHGNVSLTQPNYPVLRVRDFAGIITSLVASEIFRASDFISRYVLTSSSRAPEYVRITHFQGNENRRRRRDFDFRRFAASGLCALTKRRIRKVEVKSEHA